MTNLATGILDKVSFNRTLFTKELRKLLIWINREDLAELRDWCEKHYSHMYKKEITQIFKSFKTNNAA